MILYCKISLAALFLWLLLPMTAGAQVTAPGSAFYEPTNYPATSPNDPVFVFCTTENAKAAALRVTSSAEGPKTWLWEKYNPAASSFEFYQTESNSAGESQISQLADGCYRATVTAGGSTQVYRAWVFNDWNSATATVSESNCDFFTLQGVLTQASLTYYDLQTGAPVTLNKSIQVKWWQGEEVISAVLTANVYDPPTKDTEYRLVVTDRFGCEAVSPVTYRSIVTKALFTADPMSGEAPLLVTFTNSSENGDPGSYEWFFFRNLDDIKKESEKTTLPVDSIQLTVYDDNPVYEYENSGTYQVKLVSKKRTEQHLCTDTAYLEDYIVVDTSFVEVPNVFTPNGDGTNDNFVVKFWSMQSIKVSVFNRWGRTVHIWEKGNIRGFEKTWLESVWDGRIGSRMATPGVYFYVIEGMGRDGRKRWKHGNVYLMRDKD